MHLDSLDDEQARAMEDKAAPTQISRRSTSAGTPRHPRLLHHNDRVVLANSSRVRHEASARRA